MRLILPLWRQFLRTVRRRMIPCRGHARRLVLEWLEDRTLLTGHVATLAFTPAQTAHVAGFLAAPNDFDLYTVTLHADDVIHTTVSAQGSGSGLQGVLRVFDPAGHPVALDNREGGDPTLTFQAATAGDYRIGVSTAGDDAYDLAASASGAGGTSTGTYALDVSLQDKNAAPAQVNLTGASFRLLSGDAAAWGDTVTVAFAVENRGAEPAAASAQAQLVVSDRHTSAASPHVYPFPGLSFPLAGLTQGQPYQSGPLTLRLPDAATALAAGFAASGPVDLTLQITDDPTHDTGVPGGADGPRGADRETLTIVTPVPAGVTDLAQADAALRTESHGTLATADQVDTYPFTVPASLASGLLTAEVTATAGSLIPRLTLLGPGGQLLIQSDDGRIQQHLAPGGYVLVVSAQAGVGAYRLATLSVLAAPPFAPLAAGSHPFVGAVGDVNGDGIPDLVITNQFSSSVSVLLGNGDGSFRAHQDFTVGALPFSVAVADLNGDGNADIITANKVDGTVSVLLGNGDGTFMPQHTFLVGLRPGGVTVADVNGDGTPDLVVSNYGDNTISVLLGNGDGSFQGQRVISTGSTPTKVAVADVNGDGVPDLLTADYGDDSVAVVLGNGDGSFQGHQDFRAGHGPYALTVSDVNGDGKPDVVTANYGAGTVSVLLGNGDGSFAAHQDFTAGSLPYSVAVADLNGDGRPDIVAANFGSNSVSVLLNRGDGTFREQQTIASGKSPRGVVVADVSGDGKPDLIVTNRGDNTVSVLLGRGDGSFQSPPNVAAPGTVPIAVAVADLNGDGRPDLTTADFGHNTVSILLRNRDGTFQIRQTFATGTNPEAIVVQDVNGDGIPDLITADYGSRSVSVLLGNGDGTFGTHQEFPVGNSPQSVAVADVNGDGKPDLVLPDKSNNSVTVLLGNGDGTFKPMQDFPAATGTRTATVADVNGDGIPDVIAAGYAGVSVLLGNGDGSFQAPRNFATPRGTVAVAVTDVNGDGIPDIATANFTSVSVLLGDGHGSFQPHRDFPIGIGTVSVAARDVNGDGKPDLVASNYADNTVSVLLGGGDGSFGSQQVFPVGAFPWSVAVADVGGDGKPDVITANYADNNVSVLPGRGDGTFGTQQTYTPGKRAYSVAIADVNGDGVPDRITTDLRGNTVSVFLGNGDGTFAPRQTIPVGTQPTSVLVADLNGDGRPDVVTTNSDDNSVSVLLGDGDGSFQAQHTFATGRSPRAAAVADVNGDGIPDLLVANYDDDTVSILLGRGDGTFVPQLVLRVGHRPYALATADINGDGKPDLLIADSADDTVSVLLGNGDGSFGPPAAFATGRQPFSLAAVDVNGDGKPDLVVGNYADDTVSVLLGNGDGTFMPQQTLACGHRPVAVAVGDFNGDGRPDLVSTNRADNTLTVLPGNGDGSFAALLTFAAGPQPLLTAVADVNGDGILDLETARGHDRGVGVLLGNGDNSFQPAAITGGTGSRDTPHLVDLDGDGIPDLVVLDGSGDIIFRKGLSDTASAFAPPVVLNSKEALHTSVGRPARDLTVARIGSGWAIAAADARFDPFLSSPGRFVFTVSLYTVGADDQVTRTTAFTTGALPTRLLAVDLTGQGRTDLVAADALNSSVQVAFQQAGGTFGTPITLPTGGVPSDLATPDVNEDGLPDLTVADQASGDVSVFLNNGGRSFTPYRFRAGAGLYDLAAAAGGPEVTSLAESVSLAAGDLTGDGHDDLVVVNRGNHSFTILPGDGRGGFADPRVALTNLTSLGANTPGAPGPVIVRDFDHDGHPDVAILMTDTRQIWIYLNRGDGTFAAPVINDAGTFGTPTDFTYVARTTQTPDRFLVGNAFGDILVLQGDGAGHFAVDRGNLNGAPLAVGTTKDGQSFAVVGDQQHDQLLLYVLDPRTNQFGPPQRIDSQDVALLAPGALQLVNLGDGHGQARPYLIVASQLGNDVLVYPEFSDGSFSTPESYPVGVAPVAVTVADFNGDGVPDLAVADRGSNDVAILLGAIDAQTSLWTLSPGPRLASGGDGPLAVAVRETGSAHGPDLVVTNGDGKVVIMPGIGSDGMGTGFFRDGNPKAFDAGESVARSVATADGRIFLLGTNGSVQALDPQAETFTPLSATGVEMLEPVGNLLVAGLSDGRVELLGQDGAVLASATTSIDGGFSALQPVAQGNMIDVYATVAGEDWPMMIPLELSDGVPLVGVVIELPHASPAAQTVAVPGAELLVATLLASGPPGPGADDLSGSTRAAIPGRVAIATSGISDEELGLALPVASRVAEVRLLGQG